ncbi:DUF4297 domain-containing protein [Candidatus Woesearchaeota archaeon]|nr:DUF4297 domain-containing protein [Candidatus Woesearchaeota archaeon]MCF7901757.1 DUF4297 domain-containing protein [Candidatus Woesearchaeota archaeon]MCF8013174.1 DUF4297 domain-containing protein [Candidatus Woesearchaeota archaeon]
MNLEATEPREQSGSKTQVRYDYQRDFCCNKCIELLDNEELKKVYCEFHSDCVTEDNRGNQTFYQVKGLKNKLVAITDFIDALKDLYDCFVKSEGKSQCVMVTNAQRNRDIKRFFDARTHIREGVATEKEKLTYSEFAQTIKKKLGSPENYFDGFMERIELMDESPTFSEEGKKKNNTLKELNLLQLKTVLDKRLNQNFDVKDVELIYEIIYQLVKDKSTVSERINRFVIAKHILEKIQLPAFQRVYFETNHNQEEVDKLKDQSILEGKLEKGGFSSIFIKNAKIVRYVTKFFREKASKFKSQKTIIDDFEFRLVNACSDVFEENMRKKDFNSYEMLKELEQKLTDIARDGKYASLNIEPEFVRGLIWEATSQCKFRWDCE